MANHHKTDLLLAIEKRLGAITRLSGSQSLIETRGGSRIYIRYSKMHPKGIAFYGLRRVDLNALDGHRSFLCFCTDSEPPLFIPYGDFEAVIRQSPLAADGQYKIQISHDSSSKELYLPRVGHFNVDAFGGLDIISRMENQGSSNFVSALNHS